MIVTTTPNIEGKRIVRYCGVIAGEAILGANIFKDLFAGIRDIVGGRSGTYERELEKRAPSHWKNYNNTLWHWVPMP